MPDVTFATWLFAAALLVVAFSSSAQSALVYIDRARLRHMMEEGTTRSRALTRLLDEPSSTASAILFVLTLSVATCAAAAAWIAQVVWPITPVGSVAVIVVGLLLLVLVQLFGRLVAVLRPEGVAMSFVGPVVVIGRILTPILLPLVAFEHWASTSLGLRRTTTPAEAEERLRHLVEDNADLEESEREMIESVIELADMPVREVMVPRIDVKALPVTSTVGDAVNQIVRTGHSRIPLFEETIDNIVGVVYAKDLLRHLRTGAQEEPTAPLARQPYYVPETKKVDELLHEMQRTRVHLAVVVDEYGGTAGLITIEDLIEEIVGEIQDEYDAEEAPIEQVSESEAIMDARVSIRDFNDALDLEIDDAEFDTVGGLVYHELGTVPNVGDEVRLEDCMVTVLATSGRRVTKVRVRKLTPAEPVAAANGEHANGS